VYPNANVSGLAEQCIQVLNTSPLDMGNEIDMVEHLVHNLLGRYAWMISILH
jgi:hypothetical protein